MNRNTIQLCKGLKLVQRCLCFFCSYCSNVCPQGDTWLIREDGLQSWTKLLRKLPFEALLLVNKQATILILKSPPSPFTDSFLVIATSQINPTQLRGGGEGEVTVVELGDLVKKCFFSDGVLFS